MTNFSEIQESELQNEDRRKRPPVVYKGELLVSVLRGNRQKLKFTWTCLRGPFFLNVRQWHQNDEGDWLPTPKRALGIHVSELSATFQAIVLAAEKALNQDAEEADPELVAKLRAIVEQIGTHDDRRVSVSDRIPEVVDTDSQIDTEVRHRKIDTGGSLNIGGWTVRADNRGFHRGFRKIGGVQRCVYTGKTLDGAEEKLRAATEKCTLCAKREAKPS